MKILPLNTDFPRRVDGWTLRIVERTGDVALVRKTHPEVTAPAWEVAIVQHNEAREIGGKHVEAGESLPGANAFGQKAWAPTGEAAARAKFGEVVASEARRVAAKEAA